MPDRLGERLRAVDDKQTRHRWIEAPLDQVVDQCLHHSTVLSCPLHQSKRVLDALAIDPERSHQHEMLTDVDAVDLHHHDIEAGQIRTHPSFCQIAVGVYEESAEAARNRQACASTAPATASSSCRTTTAGILMIKNQVPGVRQLDTSPRRCEVKGRWTHFPTDDLIV